MRTASAVIAVLFVASQLAPTSAQGAAVPADIEYRQRVAEQRVAEQRIAEQRAADVERREELAHGGHQGEPGDRHGRASAHHLESPDFQQKLGVAEARYVEMAGQHAAASGLPQVAPRLSNWPHRGTISSPFAPRWGGFHNGIDIAAPFFTPVHAAAPGIVTVVGRPYAAVGDLAITVGIVHGGNLATVYVHLDDRRLPVVKVGDRVSAGQLIAYVGTTGWSTGPHTHFMTVVNGRAVDPMGLLPP